MKINQLFSLKDQNAIVTGGYGILGSAMCLGLAMSGARVGVLGRSILKCDKVVELIRSHGGAAIGLEADVLDEDALNMAKQIYENEFGAVNILVNCAGGNMPGATIPPEKNFFDLDITDFDKVVRLNLTGTVLPTQIFSQSMANVSKGVIINISSMTAFRPISRVGGYSAAKSAVTNFTEWLAIEMAGKFGSGIRVNAIAPGFFLTDQNRSLLTNPDESLTSRGQQILENTPFKRFGEPEELVGTLIWLCSPASKFITGVTIPVDGGFNAYSGV